MVGKVDVTISESVKHNGEVTCLAFHNDYLYSGGADGLIKVWNKDLQLIKDVPAHSAYIYAMTINSKGWVYSSSCDGTVKCFPNVLNSNNSEVIYQSNCDDIISICCNEDDIIYFGDDKGVVSQVVNSKIENQYDLVEEVKAIAINVQTLYTARNTDAVITELKNGKKTHFTTRAVIPGRAPLALIGPVENGLRRWLIFTSRDGKGVSLVQNGCKWPVLWTKDVSIYGILTKPHLTSSLVSFSFTKLECS